MIANSDLLNYSEWLGIITLIAAVFTALAFVLKWAFRFRLVGVTGFMGVLTIGIFALSLGLYARPEITGAIPYTLVYDNGGTKTVIAVPPTVGESELEATMRQASGDLFSFGRGGGVNNQMIIRVRTILHPKAGVSLPLYLVEVRRNLSTREDDQMVIDIFPESITRLKKSQV